MEDKPDSSIYMGVADADKLFQFVSYGILLNAVGAAGVVGNTLAAVILSRLQMRSSINTLLLGLVACDTLIIFCTVSIFDLRAVTLYAGSPLYYHYAFPHIFLYAYPLASAGRTMCVYLTVLVSVERWLAVCHPFRARTLCSVRSARWCVLAAASFALLYNVPKFLEMSVVERKNADGYAVTSDLRYRNRTYITVYVHWMTAVVMYVVPFSSLVVLNACIVRRVRLAAEERARHSPQQRHEHSVTKMLLVVVLVFFLCCMLPLVNHSIEVLHVERPDWLNRLVMVSNLLVTVNSSINFVIYVIFGKKFQHVFLKMFCSGRPLPRDGGDSSRSRVTGSSTESGRSNLGFKCDLPGDKAADSSDKTRCEVALCRLHITCVGSEETRRLKYFT